MNIPINSPTQLKDDAQETTALRGNWHGPLSMQPLKEAKQFLEQLGSYIEAQQRASGATVFRLHAGVRAIALTDHVSGSFFFKAPRTLLERERMRGFGPVTVEPFATGESYPTLVDRGASHDNSRQFVQQMMASRAAMLPAAIDHVYGRYAQRWQAEGTVKLLSELQALSAAICWKWLLDVDAPREQIMLWQRHGAGLTSDSWLAKKVATLTLPTPPAKAVAAGKTLDALARQAPLWRQWVEMAATYQVPAHVLEHILVFLCTFNGVAPGRSLFPTLATFYQQPELIEQGKTAVSASLSDLNRLDADPWLENVMVESTRLFTRPRFAVKQAVTDFTLPAADGKQYAIQQGERLMAIMPFIHRDPRVFADPHRFDPTRYTRSPALAKQVFGFLWAEGSENPYGCAALMNREGPMIWKALLMRLICGATWQMNPQPHFAIDEFFDAGPVNLKLTDFA